MHMNHSTVVTEHLLRRQFICLLANPFRYLFLSFEDGQMVMFIHVVLRNNDCNLSPKFSRHPENSTQFVFLFLHFAMLSFCLQCKFHRLKRQKSERFLHSDWSHMIAYGKWLIKLSMWKRERRILGCISSLSFRFSCTFNHHSPTNEWALQSISQNKWPQFSIGNDKNRQFAIVLQSFFRRKKNMGNVCLNIYGYSSESADRLLFSHISSFAHSSSRNKKKRKNLNRSLNLSVPNGMLFAGGYKNPCKWNPIDAHQSTFDANCPSKQIVFAFLHCSHGQFDEKSQHGIDWRIYRMKRINSTEST